jgi:hypothetical protein
MGAIERAHDLRTLWYLRSPLMQALATTGARRSAGRRWRNSTRCFGGAGAGAGVPAPADRLGCRMARPSAHSLVGHIPDLRRYARSLTGDAWAADDLVQDTLERACQRWQLWSAGSDLRAWLFTLMHNLFVDGARRAVRSRRPTGWTWTTWP